MQMEAPMVAICIGLSYGLVPVSRVAPLYKRAGLPDPLLNFWLNMILVTSRSKARNLT